MTLTGTTSSGQNGLGSDTNEGVYYISQNLWGEYVIWLFLLICSLNYSHHKYNTKLYNHVKEME